VHALRLEHARERVLLARLRDPLEGASYGDGTAVAALVRDGRRYLREQAEHGWREETVLFPLARRFLSARDDLALLSAFRSLDQEWGGTVWQSSGALEHWLDQRRQPVPA
jgi:hemerythrin-like domain-containing protein